MSNCHIDANQLNNIKIELLNNEYTVTLIDDSNLEILKGYGVSITSALNDLHKNLF